MATKRNPDKAKRAASDPHRPGEECNAEPAAWAPIVDRTRCEGKADCIAVCPYDVFELGRMGEAEFRAMPFFVRLKILAHGKKTIFTPNADSCRACGLCVVACPEHALALARRPVP